MVLTELWLLELAVLWEGARDAGRHLPVRDPARELGHRLLLSRGELPVLGDRQLGNWACVSGLTGAAAACVGRIEPTHTNNATAVTRTTTRASHRRVAWPRGREASSRPPRWSVAVEES